MEVFALLAIISYLFLVAAIAPALALWPSLTLSPYRSQAIPFISMLTGACLVWLLVNLDVYTGSLTIPIMLILFVISVIRTINLWCRHPNHDWDKHSIWVMLSNLGLILTVFVAMALSAFAKSDGLSSWNLWAKHYFYADPPGADIGASFYPQLYPMFVSLLYKLIGTTEIQGAVKGLLALFPWITLNAVGLSVGKKSFRPLIYLLVALVVLFPSWQILPAYNFYRWGYADPIMASAYVASTGFMLRYLRRPQIAELVLASVCAVAASLIKQPGLLLACFSLPLIILAYDGVYRKLERKTLLIVFLGLLPGFVWIISQQIGFYHNTAVIHRSLGTEQTSILAGLTAFAGSIYQYMIIQPQLGALFILGSLSALMTRHLRWVYLLSVLPGLVIWFVLGSYHFRLGLHVIGQMGLMIVASDLVLLKRPRTHSFAKKTGSKPLAKGIFVVTIPLALLLAYMLTYHPQILHKRWRVNKLPVTDSTRLITVIHFGDGADKVFNHVLTSGRKVASPNKMISGILYGHVNIVDIPDGSVTAVYDKFLRQRPEYAFDGGTTAQRASKMLKRLTQNCPNAFHDINMRHSLHHYRLYQIDNDALQQCKVEQNDDG